jgi:hypothetical protein
VRRDKKKENMYIGIGTGSGIWQPKSGQEAEAAATQERPRCGSGEGITTATNINDIIHIRFHFVSGLSLQEQWLTAAVGATSLRTRTQKSGP